MARWSDITLEQRFAAKVSRGAADACWEWTGARTGAGYGCIKHQGRPVPAHRMAYAIAHGDIPDGMWVLHRCDNRACVNPAHLFLGDHTDNMIDMAEKGRVKSSVGAAHWNTKLTAKQVAELRADFTGAYGDYSRLGRKYGISDVHVRRIVDRESRGAA